MAAYVSVGDEPPTRPLLDALHSTGVHVLLPVIDGTALDWAAYAGADDVFHPLAPTREEKHFDIDDL